MGTEEMLETKGYRILRDRLDEAIEEGVNAIVYGPPSSEKSFVLENLCARYRAAGKEAIYVYCGPSCTETHLWRSLAAAAGIAVRSQFRWACRNAVISQMRSRKRLPAIVLDEAQHMQVDALEGIRQLHDMTRRENRKGCGIILAGSHSLLAEFLRPRRRAQLEQMLSRFSKRIQLEGMSRAEILSLAAKAFGNGKPAKLTAEDQNRLLERCTVEDPYYLNNKGKPELRTYYSSRRLLEYVRQQKKNLKSILAEPAAAGREVV